MTREELNEEIQQELEIEEKNVKKKKIVKILIKMILFITVFFIAFYSYTTYVSTVRIGVREYRIINEKIPSSFNGLKIIQFSDLHFGSTMFEENMKTIQKLINERKPDIIVYTGDLIAKNYKISAKEQEKLTNVLQNMNATLGKYAILGDEDKEEINTIFNQSNFTILKNDYDLIYSGDNKSILLVGLSSMLMEQDIKKAYSYFEGEAAQLDIYTIALLHEPDVVDEIISKYATDLFLAGHSHNGEIRIPFLNASLSRKKGAIKYNQDYYDLGKSRLYISSGLGTEGGFRLFCRPSINFFRLSNQ